MMSTRRRIILLAPAALLILSLSSALAAAREPAKGPLRKLESNPRYFTDGTGRAIYLAGSHNWHNFQDNGHRLPKEEDPAPAFDYAGYLDFLEKHHHNFFRLWRWETPKWTDAQPQGVVKYCQPHPWKRTGPGNAADGKPKFDLTAFDPEYFDRLRERIKEAGERGIYVSIMLFEGWELQFTDAWKCHPFHGPNNVNDVDADPNGKGTRLNELHEDATGKKVLSLQHDYLKKVVDAVNDLDNVLYEVCNEANAQSTPWQYHVIDFVHEYERSKPKQHPVGITFMYAGGSNKALFDSPADWVSPNPGSGEENYRGNPTPNTHGKVVVNDTDHLWGHTGGDSVWAWRSFARGLNMLFMEELLPSPTWQDSARAAMGQTRRYAEKMNLARMTPQPKLMQTGFILADPEREYLAYQDGSQGEFWVDLSGAKGRFQVEWFDPTTDKTHAGKPVEAGSRRTFTTPFPGPAVLYLKSESAGK